MKKHNGIVSVWKFIFAIVIAFFHTNGFYPNYQNPIFRWGYIAVEFYFIITGFYFAKKVLNEKYNIKTIGKETNSFIISKFKTFILPLAIIYVINMIFLIIYSDFNTSQLMDVLWNALLLRNFGIGKTRIMRQLWYLGTMLFALHVLYPLLKKYKENLICIVSPIVIVLGLGLLGHNYGSLDVSDGHWLYIINPSLIRTFADINIGMFLYLLHKKLSGVEFTLFFKTILTFFGEGILILILFIISVIKNANRYDFIMLLMFCIAILIITSEKTFEFKILSNKFTAYLEKLGLYIFINHMTWIYFVSVIFVKYTPIQKSLISVGIVLIFSLIEERVFAILKKRSFSLKSIFIKDFKEVRA